LMPIAEKIGPHVVVGKNVEETFGCRRIKFEEIEGLQ